jgi:hypothetical protein
MSVEAAAEPQAPEQPAQEVVPVVAQQPSSASTTQQPEVAPEASVEPLPLQDAVKAVLIFVKAHRTVGDSDLDAAVADVEAALAAQDEQA